MLVFDPDGHAVVAGSLPGTADEECNDVLVVFGLPRLDALRLGGAREGSREQGREHAERQHGTQHRLHRAPLHTGIIRKPRHWFDPLHVGVALRRSHFAFAKPIPLWSYRLMELV